MTTSRGTKDVLVRFPLDVYTDVKAAADLAGTSVNSLIVDTMRASYSQANYTPGTSPGDVLSNVRLAYAASITSSTPPPTTTAISASVQNAIQALAGQAPEEDQP